MDVILHHQVQWKEFAFKSFQK